MPGHDEYEQRKAAGTCGTCGSRRARPGLVACSECTENARGNTTRNARKLRSEGRCTSCCKPSDQDRWLCTTCESRKASQTTRAGRAAYRRERVARGECLQCGDQHDTGKQNCPACVVKRREYKREYTKMRLMSDPGFAIRCGLSRSLCDALRGRPSDKRNARRIQHVGCTVGELRQHLEAQFGPGMTWENKGEWHVDHIVSLAKFDLTNPEQLAKAAHFTNLQPLWAQENLRKHAA